MTHVRDCATVLVDDVAAAAAAVRRPRSRHAPPPVDVERVHAGVLATALRIAGGDPARLRFLSRTVVEVEPCARWAIGR